MEAVSHSTISCLSRTLPQLTAYEKITTVNVAQHPHRSFLFAGQHFQHDDNQLSEGGRAERDAVVGHLLHILRFWRALRVRHHPAADEGGTTLPTACTFNFYLHVDLHITLSYLRFYPHNMNQHLHILTIPTIRPNSVLPTAVGQNVPEAGDAAAEGRDVQAGHGRSHRLPNRLSHLQHRLLGGVPPLNLTYNFTYVCVCLGLYLQFGVMTHKQGMNTLRFNMAYTFPAIGPS